MNDGTHSADSGTYGESWETMPIAANEAAVEEVPWDWLNGLVENAPQCCWDEDVSQLAITTDYVRHLEAEVARLGGSLHKPGWHDEEADPALCICPRFSDTGGYRIADLCCPIHGVNGSDPGDGYWDGYEPTETDIP